MIDKNIVKRVRNCNRPAEVGGPVSISLEDAQNILRDWKEAMEYNWNKGWDDENDGEVQFVSFFGGSRGAVGSTGRMLKEITLDNNKMLTIAIVVIAIFSALFLFSADPVESRVMLTSLGVGLVVLSYYAGVGISLLLGIKVQ